MRMKRVLLVLFSVVLSMSVLHGQGSPGLAFTLIDDGRAYEVSSGTAHDFHVIIPAFYNGLPVTRIGSFAYPNPWIWGYESIYIPEGVLIISDFAFYMSGLLSEIIIPNSVTRIGDNAFHDNNRLSKVVLGNGLKHIGRSAFYRTRFNRIIIPNSVEYIGDNAFRENRNLTEVVIGSNVARIGSYAFEDTRLTSVIIPGSVASIGINPFRFSSTLISIVVDENNTHYRSEGNSLIRNSDNTLITGLATSTIPYGVVQIGDFAFQDQVELNEIAMPNTVTHVGRFAFSGCINLTSIILSSNLTSISGGMFSGCTSLTHITIPNSVTSIGNSAFSNCVSLYNIVIPNSVTSIGFNAFASCIKFYSIAIPNSVTNIGSGAFYNCTNLEKVTIPISVTTMGPGVFRQCPKLTIYAEATDQPPGWHTRWNPDYRPVVWGHVSEGCDVEAPSVSALVGNFPNPFNPETTIAFSLTNVGNVVINVYNVRGQRVRTLVNGHHEPGEHNVVWKGRDDSENQVGSGVYFYQMSIRDAMNTVNTFDTRKMILLK